MCSVKYVLSRRQSFVAALRLGTTGQMNGSQEFHPVVHVLIVKGIGKLLIDILFRKEKFADCREVSSIATRPPCPLIT